MTFVSRTTGSIKLILEKQKTNKNDNENEVKVKLVKQGRLISYRNDLAIEITTIIPANIIIWPEL